VPYALYAKTVDGISTGNITNWNSAYAWGNHAGLYRPITYVPDWSQILNKPAIPVAADGSETKLLAGTNITVTGAGTIASPYVVNSTVTTGGTSQWLSAGNNISNTNTGNVGIGVSDPLFKLDMTGQMFIRGIGNPAKLPGVVFSNTQGDQYRGLVGMQSDSLMGFYGIGSNMPNSGWGLNMNVYNGRVGINTNNAQAALHVEDGAVLFSTYNSGTDPAPDPPAEGMGSRMMWYPGKAAFRAGYTTVEWDKDSIGINSIATGWRTKAIGRASTSMGALTNAGGLASTSLGYYTSAYGHSSTSMGFSTSATGDYSTSMGNTTKATGDNSISMGNTTKATGDNSTSMGYTTKATGDNSTSMGFETEASGTSSTAMGAYTKATTNDATSMGYESIARGSASVAMGVNSIAKAYGSTVLGMYNDSTDNPQSANANPTDRIFQVGNGTSTSRSNAVTVLRNGDVGIGTATPSATLEVNGFTKLGSDAPAVKFKKLESSTSAFQGGSIAIAHGLDFSKILAVEVMVQSSTYIHHSYTLSPGEEFHYVIDNTFVHVWNKPLNSGLILLKPVKVLITYEE